MRVFVLIIFLFSFGISQAQICDTIPLNSILCEGDTLFIADTSLTSSGNFDILQIGTPCDTLYMVNLAFRNLPEVIIEGDSMICDYPTDIFLLEDYAEYAWSTGENSQGITVSTPAIYCVTVTDDNGCKNSDCIQVISGSLDVQILGDTLFCFGSTNSLIADPRNGDEPFAYVWSGPDNFIWNLDVVNALIPGQYCLEMNDANGCSGASCIEIVHFPITEISDTVINGATSSGGGSIDITLDPANGPYQYFWSNEKNTEDISNLTAGNYNVVIVDKYNCSSLFELNVPLISSTDNYNQTLSCQINPNPIQLNQAISVTCDKVLSDNFQLLDMEGREIFRGNLSGSNTNYQFVVNKKLNDGLYYIRLKTSSDQEIIQKLFILSE